MRIARVRFTIGRLMTVIAASALILTPFAWQPPGSRWTFLIGVLTVGSLSLIVASPFLLDGLGGRQGRLPHRRSVTRRLPPAVAADPPPGRRPG